MSLVKATLEETPSLIDKFTDDGKLVLVLSIALSNFMLCAFVGRRLSVPVGVSNGPAGSAKGPHIGLWTPAPSPGMGVLFALDEIESCEFADVSDLIKLIPDAAMTPEIRPFIELAQAAESILLLKFRGAPSALVLAELKDDPLAHPPVQWR